MSALAPVKWDDDLIAQRTANDQLYSEWLSLRARDVVRYDDPDEEVARDEARLEELARLITTTPAPYFWVVLRKLEVLEYYLGSGDGAAWSDNREVVMLGGIKADLLRVHEGRG